MEVKANVESLKQFLSKEYRNVHTLEDWQRFFEIIFKGHSDQLEKKFIWLKVIEKAANLAEATRKYHYDDATMYIARLFCWLCSFCSHNEAIIGTRSLGEIIWNKYPYVCPHCADKLEHLLEKENTKSTDFACVCDTRQKEAEPQKEVDETRINKFKSKNEGIKPDFLDKWLNMFNEIYASRIGLISLESIAFHLLEEVGEVVTALGDLAELVELITQPDVEDRELKIISLMEDHEKDNRVKNILKNNSKTTDGIEKFKEILRKNVQEEIADVFSWLAAIVIKITQQRENYIIYDVRYASSPISPLSQEPAMQENILGLLKELVPKERAFSTLVSLEYAKGCTLCDNIENNKVECFCKVSLAKQVI